MRVELEDKINSVPALIPLIRHRVVRRLVLELEAEHAVELHRAIEIAHPHTDVVDRGNVDALQFSSLKPMALTILLHFACSAARKPAYSCGVPGEATPLTLANC